MKLVAHPLAPCDANLDIEVQLDRVGAELRIVYRATGAIERLAIPSPASPMRKDELWRRTCFEAFLRPAGGEAYVELNFSPSSEWAAYGFTGYRQGMAPLELELPPTIELIRTERSLELSATVRLGPSAGRIALAAVIEEVGGRLSYWALAHPAGRPDFHHAAGYVLETPLEERA